MDSLRFTNSYRSVFNFSKLCGMPLPAGLYSRTSQHWFSAYNKLVTLVLIWKVVCSCHSAVSNAKFEDKSIAEGVAMLQVTGIILTVIYSVRSGCLGQLIDEVDALSEKIRGGQLGGEAVFADTFSRDSRLLQRMNRLMCISSIACPFAYCASTPVRQYLAGEYRSSLPLPIYCTFERAHFLYELFSFLQFVGLFIPALQKLYNEYLMFGLIRVQVATFKYLTESMKAVSREMGSSAGSRTKEKLIQLAKIHQESLKIVDEFQSMFSAVVVVYYISMICIVTCGLFFQLNADKTNIVEWSTLGMYMVITIAQFFILCFLIDGLAEEMEKLAVELYFLPWYLLDSEARGFLRLMITIANRPHTLMAYRAPSFSVNREAFLAFMVNLVSAYMGFSKLKSEE